MSCPTLLQPTKHRILGIDPGSLVVGFAVIETQGTLPKHPRQFSLKEVGVLKAHPSLEFTQRISKLHLSLSQLAEEIQPTICVMEKAFVGLNITSALRLGEARGALISALSRQKIPLAQVSPTAVKKTITGQGRASKDQVLMALETLIGFRNTAGLRHDASDALSIALAYGMGTNV